MSYGWDAIYQGEQGDASAEIIPWVTENGRMVRCEDSILVPKKDGKLRREKVGAIMGPDTPLRYLLINVSESTHKQSGWITRTSFPFLYEGIPNSFRLKKVVASDIPVEAYIETETVDQTPLTFFDPTYFMSRTHYEVSEMTEFSLAGLAFDLYPAEDDWVDVTKGPLLESERARRKQEDPSTDISRIKSVRLWLKGAALCIPRDGEPDMCSIRSQIEEVDSFKVIDTRFYRLRVQLIRTDDRPISTYIYVSEPTLADYVPRKGDEVEGTLWLQGYPFALREILS